VYGSAGDLRELEAIAVTKDSLPGALLINKIRIKNGLRELKIIKIKLIQAEDHRRISSTRIRLGQIDRLGRVLDHLKPFGYTIPENLRINLKFPQDTLLKNKNSFLKVIPKLIKELVSRQQNLLVTVGDQVTRLVNQHKIKVDLAIVDFRVKRRKIYSSMKDLNFDMDTQDKTRIITVRNEPGKITKTLVTAIRTSLNRTISDGKSRIIKVNGEEDLAAVPAIILSPFGSVVIYGQPNEGVVVVQVTEEKKSRLIKLMEKNINIHESGEIKIYDEALKKLCFVLTDAFNQKKRVLIFMSGGSSVNLYAKLADWIASKKIIGGYLAIVQVDERFQPFHGKSKLQIPNSKNNEQINACMIAKTGLWDVCQVKKIPYYLVSQEGLLAEAADSYNKIISDLFKKYDYKIAVLGIGEDGHTAGLLPGYRQKWDLPRFVAGYENNGKFNKRISLTPKVLKSLNYAVVIAVGAKKRNAIERLLKKDADTDLNNFPAAIINNMRNTNLYTDLNQ
ncbi:DUF359 domain-containing protein, partial [Candidatus Gottesmanbacteria bacterium]|nr:DUF359 domain-containing protein [Candidatus Gottesmanbacteria bacterium]